MCIFIFSLLLQDKEGLSSNQKVIQFCQELYDNGNRSPYLLALLVDMCDEQISQEAGDVSAAKEKGIALCKELANTYDTIRCNYWEYMASVLEKKGSKSNESTSEATSTSN